MEKRYKQPFLKMKQMLNRQSRSPGDFCSREEEIKNEKIIKTDGQMNNQDSNWSEKLIWDFRGEVS